MFSDKVILGILIAIIVIILIIFGKMAGVWGLLGIVLMIVAIFIYYKIRDHRRGSGR